MSTISPNMSLLIPTVGSTIGPGWAIQINDSLTLIDSHDHTPGKGNAITPAGININDDLNFNNHFATSVAGLTLVAQSVTPPLNTLYESGTDLYFIDGVGNNIRITQSGGIAGSPGSITNLAAPASVTWVSGNDTYVFQSNVNIAANLDAASILLRNISPNSTNALTLQPPAALVSNYSLTLPSLPAVQSFMTLNAAGQMAAPWTVDNSTIKIIGNQLVAQVDTLTPNREHAWELNGNYSLLTMPLINIDSIFIAPVNININNVWIYIGTPGTDVGSITEFDLKVSNPQSGTWTSILSTTGKVTQTLLGILTDTYTDSGSVIAAISGVTKPVLATTLITAGQALRFDMIQSMTGGSVQDARIRIYYTIA